LRTLEFSFRSLPFRGKHMLAAEALSFGYPGQPVLFKDLNISVNNGDRICVIGPNGMGKTTLLKILAGLLDPQNGQIAYHPSVVSGFYEQTNIQTLNDLNTIETEILTSAQDLDRQQARNICGAMLFEGDAALKKIKILSGGEKARVMLGKILATPVNLLLLDEPSNHLDMESCDALIAALDNFDGTLIMVTHNEMFLHALAQRLIVFDGHQATTFEGTYQDFLDKGGWGDEAEGMTKATADGPQEKHPPGKVNKKKLRRRRSAVLRERSQDLKPVEKAIAQAEAAIEAQEHRLAELNQAMMEASRQQKGERIAGLSRDIHHCQKAIDAHFAELENLYQQKDALDKVYEQRLAELDDDGDDE
jgi:ATP-binding cassette subfamily F protein 3